MGIPSAPEDGGWSGWDDDLLLQTSETVLQIAHIARVNEVNEETRVFYSHLGFHCVRLRDHARRARQSMCQLNGELVNQALDHLGSLVPESALQEPKSYSSRFRLGALNLHWSEERKQPDEAKLHFIRQWLRPGTSEEQRDEVDRSLESCADELDKQQPKQPYEPSVDKFPHPEIGEPTYAVGKASQSIFDALLDCKGCSCPGQHDFGAKLGLGTYRKPEKKIDKKPPGKSIRDRLRKPRGDDDSVVNSGLEFDMFLSMERDWHEVRIRTVQEKAVSFNLPGEAAPSPRGSNAADDRHAKVDRLCRPITKTKTRDLQRLVLKLTGGQLFDMGFEKSGFWIDKSTTPISLFQCFEERHEFFTEKTKRILSLIVGYTVLYLNGTSWLQPGWGSANIKFFQTTSCKTPLRPFIQTQLPKANATDFGPAVNGRDGDNDASDELDFVHRCPALVALAVILMEVYFVKPFMKLAQMHDIPLSHGPGSRISPIDVDLVFNGVEDDNGDFREGWRSHIPEDSPLLTAIDNCLDCELWEDEQGEALDSATLRSQVYQHVVRLLELHLTHGFSQIPLDGVDRYARDLDFGRWGQAITGQGQEAAPLSLRGLTSTRTPSPSFMPFTASQVGVHPIQTELWKQMSQYPQPQPLASSCATPILNPVSTSDLNYKASQFFDDEIDDGKYSAAGTKRYLKWRSEYEKVYTRFITDHLPDLPSNPVKIAILDTGIDRDHYAFEAREECLRGKHNCYNESQKSVPDRNGHGTFAASLILDYAPDVALYVIKIVDKENARPDANMVAKAIKHAVDKWNVDIISMSFGWPSSDFDGHSTLQGAIDSAYANKVLMFAAASNSGGRLGRAYPASSSQVICVHSTNTYGSASDFSPTPEPNAVNLATVGESVESAWPMHLCPSDNMGCTVYRSGTSYATPIMAGMAAFLLQYARIHLPESAAVALKRRERMEGLLRRCAQHGPNYQPRDGYFYVGLSLDKHNLFGGELEWVNHEILRALGT
ncbi:hypothetical protein F5144DRAFT_533854 [Chaetomium tenue]|uniref:Uncharacterized protein n=1 Tax=Chaetomium tenue TaxID=1854479 RepID=A0ACB7PA87_9PEZI|nr:hypothetical protein F5144DRAFT_533854 [Chaetomium globosum]